LYAPDDGTHRLVGQSPRANRIERFVQQLKIAKQLVGALILAGPVARPPSGYTLSRGNVRA
jgi:hypothetical protein